MVAERASRRLTTRQRTLAAFAGVTSLCFAVILGAAGFALSGVWPGLSWAFGGALALVAIFSAVRLLRAAITGYSSPGRRGPPEQRGVV